MCTHTCTLEKTCFQPLVLNSGSPLFSMAQAMARDSSANVHLLYTVQSQAELLFEVLHSTYKGACCVGRGRHWCAVVVCMLSEAVEFTLSPCARNVG